MEDGVCLEEPRRPVSAFNLQRRASTIGKYIVGRANDTARLHLKLYKTLRLLDPDSERKRHIHAQFGRILQRVKSVETPSARPFETWKKSDTHGLGGRDEPAVPVLGRLPRRRDRTTSPVSDRARKNTPPHREHVPGFPSPARLAGCTDQTGRAAAEGPNDLNQRPRRARQVHAPDRRRRQKAVGICRRGDGRAGRGVQYRLGPRLRGHVLQLVRQAPGRVALQGAAGWR